VGKVIAGSRAARASGWRVLLSTSTERTRTRRWISQHHQTLQLAGEASKEFGAERARSHSFPFFNRAGFFDYSAESSRTATNKRDIQLV